MEDTYRAIYINEAGQRFPATIFLSSVTLTIRYRNEHGEEKELYWLGERVQSIDERPADTRLYYPGSTGNMQQLQIRDLELVSAIKKNYRSYKFIGGFYHHTLGKTHNKIFLILGVLLFLFAGAYLWFLPWIGERIAVNFSKEFEIELGNTMYTSSISSYKIDSAKTVTINNFYKELKYRVDYPVIITVVEATEVNAFAIPGGNIIVHEAILEGMKTPEELAALLGHEASHIAKRHSLRTIFRGLARKMFLLLLVGYDDGMVRFFAENADALKGLQYSRALETEADSYGMLLMAESGLNTNGMLQLMEILQKETAGKEPASFMSTHPVFKDRMENIRIEMGRYPKPSIINSTLSKLFHDLHEKQ